jgi:hypothetical protein
VLISTEYSNPSRTIVPDGARHMRLGYMTRCMKVALDVLAGA